MKKYLTGFAIAVLILGIGSQPVRAQSMATVVVYNESDAWGWTTAYSSGIIIGAWCTNPKSHSSRQFKNSVGRLRVEVTKKNCAHPVMLDRSFDPTSKTWTVAHLRGQNGSYSWSSR